MVIRCLWDPDRKVFVPHGRSLAACEKLEPATWYTMAMEGDWSVESHNHYFARLTELYHNLPEATATRFRNFDHFRAWCLIHEGFSTEQCQIYESESVAQIAAKAIAKIAPYSVADVSGSVLRIWTAKSQARGSMSKKEFEKSKQAVLELAEFLVQGGELAA